MKSEMVRRSGVAIALLLVLSVMLSACTPAAQQGSAKPEGGQPSVPAPAKERDIKVRLTVDMSTIDPAHIGQVSDHAIGYLVYNGLVRYKAGSLEVVPDLATKWEISDDGKVYTFHLRQGVQWHKGYGELTADDVVYSLNRIKNPETKSRYQADLNVVEKVEATDKYTVRITLKEAFSSLLSAVMAFRPGWIVNKKAIEEKGQNYGVDPIGTGPYVFQEWKRGSEVKLVRNANYHLPLAYSSVTMKVIKEDSVAELALQAGELDVAYLYEGESASRLLKSPGTLHNSKQFPDNRTQWVAFNLERPAVKDIRVRQAIIYAIDKKAVADAVYQGMAQVVASIFNPNIPGYVDMNPFPYNPDKAKQLLAEAGYEKGVNIKVLVHPTRGWPEMATVLQDQWKRVGINAELINQERAVYDQLTKGSDYDLHPQNISRADAFQFASFLYGKNSPFPNTTRYKGADQLIEAANRENDQAKRMELWRQFQEKVLVQDVVGFGMTNLGYVMVWKKDIDGVTFMYQDSYPVEQMKPKQ